MSAGLSIAETHPELALGYFPRRPLSSNGSTPSVKEFDTFRHYPVTDQALRKSCDRCYVQKLKCTKNDAKSNRCVRCQRAGLQCFYSSRLARRTQKRARSLENAALPKNPQPYWQYPFSSSGFENQVMLDPFSLGYFDLHNQDVHNSFSHSEIPTEYAWPPKEWESAVLLPELSKWSGKLPQVGTQDYQAPAVCASKDDSNNMQSDLLDKSNMAEISSEDSVQHSKDGKSDAQDALVNVQLESGPLSEQCVREPLSTGLCSNTGLKLVLDNVSNKRYRTTCQNQAEHLELSVVLDNNSNIPVPTRNSSLDDLTSLSRSLEKFLSRMSTAEPVENLQNYPVGEALDGSRRLLNILQRENSLGLLHCQNPYSQETPNDQYSMSGRTTNSLLALQCYILCVKTLARLSQKLLSHPSMATDHSTEAARASHRSRMSVQPGNLCSSPDTAQEKARHIVEDALSTPLHSGLLLGELYVQLHPVAHFLNCVSGALSTGMKLLRAIEVSLGIPRSMAVQCDPLFANTEGQTDFPDPVALQTPMPTPSSTCSLTGQPKGDGTHSCNKGWGNSTLVERLLTVLWDEEAMLDTATGSWEAAPIVLQRCCEQIHALSQQHALFPYST